MQTRISSGDEIPLRRRLTKGLLLSNKSQFVVLVCRFSILALLSCLVIAAGIPSRRPAPSSRACWSAGTLAHSPSCCLGSGFISFHFIMSLCFLFFTQNHNQEPQKTTHRDYNCNGAIPLAELLSIEGRELITIVGPKEPLA